MSLRSLSFVSALRRRWLRAGLRTKGLLVVSIPILPLLLLDTAYLIANSRRNEADAQLGRMHLVETELHALIADISEAESDVRGFLVTRDRSWTHGVDAAQSRLSQHLARLDALVADPLQRSVLEHELAKVSEARLAVLQQTLRDVDSSGDVQRGTLDAGRSAMQDLRAIVARMVVRERQLLVEGRERARTVGRWGTLVIVGVTLAGIAAGLLAAVLLSHGVVTRIARVAHDAERLEAGEVIPRPDDEEQDEIGSLRRRLRTAGDLVRTKGQQLEAAKAELDSFFTVTPDMLCLANSEGVFTRVNPAWSALGWSTEQLTGSPYVAFVHPDDRETTLQQAGRLVAGDSVVSFENRYAAADGSYRWLSWHARLDSKTGLIAAVARDITHRRAIEVRLQELNQQLQDATHAKNDFLSRMSHDLRTPLNAVIGFAQLLEAEALAPDQRESVHQILNGSRHLLQLIDEVLQITRVEAGHVTLSTEPIALADIVTRAVALIRPLADRRGLRVAVDVGPDDWVMADRQRLSDILLNLLSNAVKYNRVGGMIDVRADRHDDRIRIGVTDTGFGISEEKLPRLFTPFDRLGAENGPEEGTGLGLALAKTFATAMGGNLIVETTGNVGSTFWIELPRAEIPVAAVQPDVESAAAVSSGAISGLVLYIDDTPSNLLLARRVLERRADVQVLTASCGEDGIRLATESQPCLILLDLHLPDMHGDVVLQRLRQAPATRTIPVVVVSADATPATAERVIAHGAVGYLSKPLDIHRLLRLVDEYCQVA